jgi:hypothetical protein
LSASAVSLNSNPRATGSITTVMPGARLDDARPPVHTETEVSNSTAVGAEYGVFAVTLVAITLILARWADRRSEPPSRAELMRQSANRFKWSSRIEAAFGAGMILYGLATGSQVGILGGPVFLMVAAVDHWFRMQNPRR